MTNHMRSCLSAALFAVFATSADGQVAPTSSTLAARRRSAMHASPDAILLFRARATEMPENANGFRQSANFYYFTGLENVLGAVLALDARRNESWLFVPGPGTLTQGFASLFRAPYGYVASGSGTAATLGLDHVVPWTEMEGFLATRLAEDSTVVLRGPFSRQDNGALGLPELLAGQSESSLWQRALQARFPRARFGEASAAVGLRGVKDSGEVATMRRVAQSSAAGLRAGLASLRPGRRQRDAEVDVLAACVKAHAAGISFWPWIMTGSNSTVMQAIQSLADARFLDREMQSGELARVDVGCTRDGYAGDVGRTAPVNGRFDAGQREAWELLVTAYRAGLAAIRPDRTTRDVITVFRQEIERRRGSLRTAFGRRTAEVALEQGGMRWVQLHGVGIEAAEFLGDTLRAGNVLAFEPILTVDGVGLYLEDMILVTATGSEVLTKGLPYTADEIERAVRPRRVRSTR